MTRSFPSGPRFAPRTFTRLLAALVLVTSCLGAHAGLFVYQMPNGTRIVTDRPIKNKDYILVRKSNAPVTMDELVAKQRTVEAWTSVTRYDDLIHEAAQIHGLAPALIKAVMHVESAFDPYAVSHRGAQGLMQITPETARRFGVKDVFDPNQNIHAGARFLAHLTHLFRRDPDLILAAYNAGITRVVKHNGVPPYNETREYVRKVRLFEEYYSGKRKKLDSALLNAAPAYTQAGPLGLDATATPGPARSDGPERAGTPDSAQPRSVLPGDHRAPQSGNAETLLPQESDPVVATPQLVSDARRRVELPEIRRPE